MKLFAVSRERVPKAYQTHGFIRIRNHVIPPYTFGIESVKIFWWKFYTNTYVNVKFD